MTGYKLPNGDPCTLLTLIRQEPEWAESYIRMLKEALQELLDEQDGPPLLRRERQWQAAVDKARKRLGYSSD